MDTSVYRDKGFSEALRKPFTKQQLLELLYALFSAPELKEAAEKPQKTASSNTGIFSLDTLYSFLGDDEDACSGILLTFIEETKANIAELEKAVVTRDFELLNRTAHKMLPMFRQFKAMPCIEDLEVFETLEPQEKSQKTILGIYTRLNSNIKVLLEAQELYLNATTPSHND
jgi:hypothetical protein